MYNSPGALRVESTSADSHIYTVDRVVRDKRDFSRQACALTSTEELDTWRKNGKCANNSTTPNLTNAYTALYSTFVFGRRVQYPMFRQAWIVPEARTSRYKSTAQLGRGVIFQLQTKTIYDLSGGCCIPKDEMHKPGDSIRVHSQQIDSPPETDVSVWRMPVVLSHSHCCGTFYHVVAESLTRFLIALTTFKDLDVLFMVPNTPELTLKMLGPIVAASNSQVTWKANTSNIQQFIAMPPSPFETQRIDGIFAELRRFFVSIHSPSGCVTRVTERVTPVLLVLERSNGKRNVVNLQELFKMLQQTYSHVKVIHMNTTQVSQMSVHATQCVLSNFCGMVSGHGGQLTNMFFLPNNSFVAELVSRQQYGRVYGRMAHRLGLSYASFEDQVIKLDRGHASDVYITDVDLVVQKLGVMIDRHCKL